MSSNQQCAGLINSSYVFDNIAPLRVAILKGCSFTKIEYFNEIIKRLKIPFIITYCGSYGEEVNGKWTGIVGQLVDNRSDFSANVFPFNDRYYQYIQYSPSFNFGNAITILSGKILANNENGFSILLRSYSLDIWLLLSSMFIVIALCNRILHKECSKWTFYLMGIVGHFMKLWAVFINQSNQQFANICCVKHLILNSVTIITIFLMTLFFNSEILSNLLFRPLVKIDTLNDLVEFVRQHDDVKLITDKLATPWLILKNWHDDRAQFILPKMTNTPLAKFDYNRVYHGESILISFDNTFERMLKFNRQLSFHMSADRLFGYQYGFVYSKYIDIKIKIFIDFIMSSLFETGIYHYNEDKKRGKRLKIDEKDPPQTISISYFKKIIITYLYGVILLIFNLIIEIFYNHCNQFSKSPSKNRQTVFW